MSCLSEIKQIDLSPIVLAGYHYQDYMSLLPKHVVIAHELQLRPCAKQMIEMFEQGLCRAHSALDIEPVYIRDQVT